MRSVFACMALFLIMAQAHADPFANGDPKKGKSLHDKSCLACHVSLAGGDGSAIYTRPARKVSNPQQLLSRVHICNTNAGASWFPEEEMHVAAYLNLTYYHFK